MKERPVSSEEKSQTCDGQEQKRIHRDGAVRQVCSSLGVLGPRWCSEAQQVPLVIALDAVTWPVLVLMDVPAILVGRVLVRSWFF